MACRSPLVVSAVVAAIALAQGCGDGRIARYPVKGSVVVDGQPAGGALVVFCPTEGAKELMRERPYGWTNELGVYRLQTFEPGDGAPAGTFNIIVRWLGDGTTPSRDDDRAGGSVDRLHGRYTNPQESGLSYTVFAGENEVPPFQLSTE
jgi:hypothetical protein